MSPSWPQSALSLLLLIKSSWWPLGNPSWTHRLCLNLPHRKSAGSLPLTCVLWSPSLEGMGITFIPVWHGDSRQRQCILQAQLTTFTVGQVPPQHSWCLQGPSGCCCGESGKSEIKAQWGLGPLLLFCMDVLRHMHRHGVVWWEGDPSPKAGALLICHNPVHELIISYCVQLLSVLEQLPLWNTQGGEEFLFLLHSQFLFNFIFTFWYIQLSSNRAQLELIIKCPNSFTTPHSICQKKIQSFSTEIKKDNNYRFIGGCKDCAEGSYVPLTQLPQWLHFTWYWIISRPGTDIMRVCVILSHG